MKIVFFGTPKFAVPFLEVLAADPDIEVAAVVTQPDKPAGRGGALQVSAVKHAAERFGLPMLQPKTLKDDAAAESLSALGADAFVVVAYGKLIPPAILEIPRLGCVNVHPSLLPKYRGPSPMQWAIAEGDAKTGVSVMLLDEGMDTGPILAQEQIPLDPDETAPSLESKVQQIGPPLLVDTLKRLASGDLTPIPQDDAAASLTRLLTREDGRVDWSRPAGEIWRRIRAYQPWPGGWTEWTRDGKPVRIKILDARVEETPVTEEPGTVLVRDARLFVAAGDGQLEILKLQPENKAPMDAPAFVRGHSEISGAMLA